MTPRQFLRVCLRFPVLGLVCGFVSACGTDAIVVSESVLAERQVKAQWLGSDDQAGKLVFSPEDEQITLSVRFQFNYRAVYEWYKIEWLQPDGRPYKVVTTRSDFGSHRSLKASLKIRGKMAARMPGLWRVRVWLRGRKKAPDRLLVARLFRIDEAAPSTLAGVATPVDPPAADLPRPLAGQRPPGTVAGLPTGARPSPLAKPATEVVGPASLASPAAVTPRRATASIDPIPPAKEAAQTPQAAAPMPPTLARPPRATASIDPLPQATSLASVSLRVQKGSRASSSTPSLRRHWPGCPPLYYPPGPGCVEQAAQE